MLSGKVEMFKIMRQLGLEIVTLDEEALPPVRDLLLAPAIS